MTEFYVKVEIDDLTPDEDGEVMSYANITVGTNYYRLEDLIPAEYVTVDIPVDEALVEALRNDTGLNYFDAVRAVKAGWSKPL